MTGEVKHLVGEAPLVVVPSDELDEVLIEGNAGLRIEDGGVGVGTEVGGNDLVVNVLENTLHGAFGSGLHRGLDVVHGGGLLKADGQVNDGDVRSGNAHGHTGELAVELGNDLADSLRSAGGGGDDVVVNGTRAAQILLLGEAVNYGLSGGGGMDGGHETLNDAEVVVQHLRDGGEAVGGAGRVGDELHIAGVGVQIDAADEHRGVVLGGGGHDDVLGTGGDVAGGLLLGQEQAGGLDDIFSAYLCPRQVGGITLGEHGDGLAVDNDVVALGGDLALELAVHGVELQHIGQIIGRAQIVDAHDLDVGVIHAAAHDHTADTAKTIDTDFNAHKTSSSLTEYPKCMVCLELYALV